MNHGHRPLCFLLLLPSLVANNGGVMEQGFGSDPPRRTCMSLVDISKGEGSRSNEMKQSQLMYRTMRASVYSLGAPAPGLYTFAPGLSSPSVFSWPPLPCPCSCCSVTVCPTFLPMPISGIGVLLRRSTTSGQIIKELKGSGRILSSHPPQRSTSSSSSPAGCACDTLNHPQSTLSIYTFLEGLGHRVFGVE